MLLSQGKRDARIGGKSRRRARNDASAARSETLAALRRCTLWPLVESRRSLPRRRQLAACDCFGDVPHHATADRCSQGLAMKAIASSGESGESEWRSSEATH